MSKKEGNQNGKISAANTAIEILGGSRKAAMKLSSLTGNEITHDRVRKWQINGIATPWHPPISQLTGIPLNELDSDIYPAYLFVK